MLMVTSFLFSLLSRFVAYTKNRLSNPQPS
uniref:Uncharacterized protein n=1 Tax=Arundo donax TaxID=35708 RepID=A0A0A9G3F9_ARUDO